MDQPEPQTAVRTKDEERGVGIKMDDDAADLKYRKRHSDRNTVAMLDILIRFFYVISISVIVGVACYMIIWFPKHAAAEKLQPEVVAIYVTEGILVCTTILLWCVGDRPEGRVVVYSLAIAIASFLLGNTFSVVFRVLLFVFPQV